jgi:hypothetical protein
MSSEVVVTNVEKTWKPTTAGVLNIISGSIYFFCFIGLLIAGAITGVIKDVPEWVPTLLYALSIPSLILGAVAIIGGILAIRRRSWGMAIAGAISAFLISFIFGLCAIIFLALSQKEFN